MSFVAQGPPGVPAACVGVDRGDNAGLLAVQILAISNESLASALVSDKQSQYDRVLAQDEQIQGEL